MDALTENSAARWYVVHCKPLQESRADVNLRSLGIETLFPRVKKVVRTRDHGERVRIEPLFPSYVFVRGELTTMARPVRYTRGVAKFVGTDAGPVAVDDVIIDAIRSRLCDDGFIHLETCFRPGDCARITSGPLNGLVGVFHSYANGSERVRLLMAALNGDICVVVHQDALEKVS